MTHQAVSYVKSGMRIGGAIMAVALQDFTVGFILFGVAELLGILEEVVDKRIEPKDKKDMAWRVNNITNKKSL